MDGGIPTSAAEPRGSHRGAKLAFRKQLAWPPPRMGGRKTRRHAYLLTLDFAEVGGRLDCVRFELGSLVEEPSGPDSVPVTASALRSVPLRALVDQALFDETRTLRRWAREAGPGGSKASRLRDRVVTAAASLGRAPGRPPLYTEDHYKAVADVYTRAWRIGRPPREAVADKWRVSLSAAAKWVARTRAMGFLPPTGQGRALGGEARGKRIASRQSASVRRSRRSQEIDRIEEREAFELEVLSKHEAWLAKLTGLGTTTNEGVQGPPRGGKQSTRSPSVGPIPNKRRRGKAVH